MGVGARVGAPARQARSSVFWVSFERARAGQVPSVDRRLQSYWKFIRLLPIPWTVVYAGSRVTVARQC